MTKAIAPDYALGVAIDTRGALRVADDVGNTIWRVAGSPAGQ